MDRRHRIVLAITTSQSAILLHGQLQRLRQAGYDCFLISSPGEVARNVAKREGATLVEVPMHRSLRPGSDLVALVRLVVVLVKLRPLIVNAGTPKASLLVLTAAVIAGVPIRIFTLRGIRSETLRGWRFSLIYAAERLCGLLAHKVICISPSLMRRAVSAGVVDSSKVVVVGAGSSNGLNVNRYQVTPELKEEGSRLRHEHGVPDGAKVVTFVGRFSADKGVIDLLSAWGAVVCQHPDDYLLLVGSDEGDLSVNTALQAAQRRHATLRIIPWVPRTEVVYSVADVLAVPSYREGFGNVFIEAAAMKVPAVGYRVTGVVDAVADGVTGALVDPGDVGGLATAICRYLADDRLRLLHGDEGQRRAVSEFSQERIWAAQLALYADLCHGISLSPVGSR